MTDLNNVPARTTSRSRAGRRGLPALNAVARHPLRVCGILSVVGLRIIGAGPTGPALAQAGQTSQWAAGRHSAARLIDAGPHAGTASPVGRLVGLEIRLDPSFITYWRNPGEAGVPPVFDFSGSDNLGSAHVLFPAPRRFDEDGLAAFGYEAGVTFPILLDPQDAAKPITVSVGLDYAVCAKICLPATARLHLRLDGGASPDGAKVERALDDVPAPRQLGQAGPTRIERITASPDGAVVTATTPDGSGTLFAEGPDGWFVSASPGQHPDAGHLGFTLAVPDHPPGPIPHAPVRLTLVGSDQAIEVSVPLDDILPKR